jgi:methyl-accepting chemotaxis protein
MDNNVEIQKAGLWSRAKISTLSIILLVMMAGAGIFFTTAFSVLHIQLDGALNDWHTIQKILSDTGALQTSNLQAHSDQLSHSIEAVKSMTIYFIIAVLVAVGAFFILMYSTLIGKIVRPVKEMEKGILEITSTNDFSKVLNVKYQDEVGQVIRCFNGLTGDLKNVFDRINSNLEQVANGNFEQRCTVDVHGDLETLKNRVNASVDSVHVTMNSLEDIGDAISNGDFSVRMNPEVKGNIRIKIDTAMHNMDTIIQQINGVMQKMMVSDFSERVTGEAKGQMAELKSFINEAVSEISQGIQELNTATKHLSQGDLAYSMTRTFSGDLKTLQDNLQHAVSQLNDSMTQVINTSSEVAQGTFEISQGNDNLSERTQSQAASLEETASAVEQITSTVQQTSDHAQRAHQLATETMKLANDGRQVMQDSVESMSRIQESSERISDIIALIDSIAFQTNLLALNAAVEAARAGEHGRGFAVVAGEVRSLAGKSSDAANDIRKLIDEVVAKVNQGASQLNETNDAFDKINHGVQTVTEIVAEITVSAREQATGIGQVNQAISQLDSAVQQNAALVEETAANASHLTEQAIKLQQDVSGFQVKTSPSHSENYALPHKD